MDDNNSVFLLRVLRGFNGVIHVKGLEAHRHMVGASVVHSGNYLWAAWAQKGEEQCRCLLLGSRPPGCGLLRRESHSGNEVLDWGWDVGLHGWRGWMDKEEGGPSAADEATLASWTISWCGAETGPLVRVLITAVPEPGQSGGPTGLPGWAGLAVCSGHGPQNAVVATWQKLPEAMLIWGKGTFTGMSVFVPGLWLYLPEQLESGRAGPVCPGFGVCMCEMQLKKHAQIQSHVRGLLAQESDLRPPQCPTGWEETSKHVIPSGGPCKPLSSVSF